MASNSLHDRHGRNTARNLHVFVHKRNKSLNVKVAAVKTPIKSSTRYKKREAMWPVLHLSEWFRVACMEPYDGFYFLGGLRLHEDLDSIKHMLRDFWNKHKYHDNFGPPPIPELTIPFYLHGDEGRGQVKRPILVVSFQPCISWMGGEYHNMKKTLMEQLATFWWIFQRKIYKLAGFNLCHPIR